MKAETALTSRFLKKLRAIPRSWWVKVSQRSQRGTPDVIGCVPCDFCGDAKFVALEVKTETGEPDPLQEHELMLLLKSGAYSRVVRLPRESDAVLSDLLRLISGEPV